MPGKVIKLDNIRGLSRQEIALLQEQYGKNIFTGSKEHRLYHILLDVFREPMLILLLIALSISRYNSALPDFFQTHFIDFKPHNTYESNPKT